MAARLLYSIARNTPMKEQLESNILTKYAAGLMEAEELSKLEDWLKQNPQFVKFLVTVNVPTSAGAVGVKVHPDFAAKLNAVFSQVSKRGLHIYIKSCAGGLAVRNVTGGQRLSNHAWGTALDINSDQSGYTYGCKWNEANQTIYSGDKFLRNWNTADKGFYEIVKIMRGNGIKWLGNTDPMHFSIYE